MKKVLILDTAKKMPAAVLDQFLEESFFDLVFYGKDLSTVRITAPEREEKIEGDMADEDAMAKAMDGVDYVFFADTSDETRLKHVISAMKKAGKDRLICTSVVGIYDEVPGKFGEYNREHRGPEFLKHMRHTADLVENSGLNYTILRLPFDYTNDMNDEFTMRAKGQPFDFTQISRQAVGSAVVGIVRTDEDKYDRTNIALGEPGTQRDKPIFDPSRA